MPVLPIANSFRRQPANCNCAGWEKISLLPTTSVNWTSTNASPAIYYNTSGSFTTSPFPILAGTNYIFFDAFKDSLRVEIKQLTNNKVEVTISGSFEFNCALAIRIDQLRSQCGFIANMENCNGSQMIIGVEPNNLTAVTELTTSNIEGGKLKFTKFDWNSGTMGEGDNSAKGVFELKGVFQYMPKCTTGLQTIIYLS